MKSEYQTPTIKVYNVEQQSVICSSPEVPKIVRCDNDCRVYHICRDRMFGMFCTDKVNK